MGKDIFLYRRRGFAMVRRKDTHTLAHFGDPCSARYVFVTRYFVGVGEQVRVGIQDVSLYS